jgi:hypothetical protein
VDTSYDDLWLSCSSNGSSLGQWARAERADGRITSKRMRGADVLTRAVLRPVAPGRRTPAWLALASLPSRTNGKIQGATSSEYAAPMELFHFVNGGQQRCRADGAPKWRTPNAQGKTQAVSANRRVDGMKLQINFDLLCLVLPI